MALSPEPWGQFDFNFDLRIELKNRHFIRYKESAIRKRIDIEKWNRRFCWVQQV